MHFFYLDIATALGALLGYQAFVVTRRRQASVAAFRRRSLPRPRRNAVRIRAVAPAGRPQAANGGAHRDVPGANVGHLVYVDPRRLIHLR